MQGLVAMATGGMDTLPHNGAVIMLLAVTVIKTLAVFFVIAVYDRTGLL